VTTACDKKKVHIDEKEFEKISNRIQTVLAPQPLPSKELMDPAWRH
jgi:hypothetical protein